MPRIGLDPKGFRNVRRTPIRRVARRIAELGLVGPAAYHAYLEAHPAEWRRLEAMCWIPISRLYRDADVFALLERELFPELAAKAKEEGRAEVRVWSAGCASGEEPCSVVLAWSAHAASLAPELRLDVVATDADPSALARAEHAEYTESSASELPEHHRVLAFGDARARGGRVREAIMPPITFREQDLRTETPEGPFDVVLCRNLAFTYFDEATRRAVAERLVAALAPKGFLIVGRGERLPEGTAGVRLRAPLVYERSD